MGEGIKFHDSFRFDSTNHADTRQEKLVNLFSSLYQLDWVSGYVEYVNVMMQISKFSDLEFLSSFWIFDRQVSTYTWQVGGLNLSLTFKSQIYGCGPQILSSRLL